MQNEKCVMNEIDAAKSCGAFPIIVASIIGGIVVLLMTFIIICMAIAQKLNLPTWIRGYIAIVVFIGIIFMVLAAFFHRKYKKVIADELQEHCRYLKMRYSGLEVDDNVGCQIGS